jgi:hypothetical protein
MSLEINISFLIPKRCNEFIQVSEKYKTTAYCTGKISENYEVSNTEHHSCIGSTMHYIHDVLGSRRCPERNWFLFSTACLTFSSKVTEWCLTQSFPNHCPPLFTPIENTYSYPEPLTASLNKLSSHQWLAAIGKLHGPPVAVWTGLVSLAFFTWYSGIRYKALGSTIDLNHTLMTSWSLLYIIVRIATPHERT